MSEWAAYCERGWRDAARAAVKTIDEDAEVVFARSADALRALALGSVPGELGVIVGPSREGIADINLAAAIARDGGARSVVLLGEGVTGSLRSRAARAGIDRVLDVSEACGGASGEGLAEGSSAAVRAGGLPPSVCGARPFAGERPSEQGGAPILVFCSGRGGVGKTSVVALAAAHAASWGMSVCAVDLDLSCGNLYAAFGLPGGSDLARLDGGAEFDEAVAEGLCLPAAPGIRLAGPCERPETAELAMTRVGDLLRHASQAHDLVLVDTSTTFTDAVAQAAQLCDRLVIVSDGAPGSISSLARTSGLAVRLGVARTRIARLENRASQRSRMDPSFARAELGLEAARVFRAYEGGEDARECLAAGGAVGLAESGLPFPASVATMLAQVLTELGRLPGSREAERAATAGGRRPRGGLFGRRREAM